MKPRPYTVEPIKDEDPKEIERQRDEYRAALIGIIVTAATAGVIYWLTRVL